MSHQLINKPAPGATKKGLNDLQAIRKRNLRALIKQWDGPTNLAKELRYSGPSFVSQMIGPKKPITERTAHGIEDILSLPRGWMDTDHAAQMEQPATQQVSYTGVDTSMINNVMTSVREVLEDASIPVHPCLTQLVSLVYEHAVAHGRVDSEYIERLVKLAVK